MNWYKISKKSLEEIAIDIDPSIQSNADSLIRTLYKMNVDPFEINPKSKNFDKELDDAIFELINQEGDINTWKELKIQEDNGVLNKIRKIVKKTYKDKYRDLKNQNKVIPIPQEQDSGGGGGTEGLI